MSRMWCSTVVIAGADSRMARCVFRTAMDIPTPSRTQRRRCCSKRRKYAGASRAACLPSQSCNYVLHWRCSLTNPKSALRGIAATPVELFVFDGLRARDWQELR
jgi:hypothetical protein